jgi:hypothetical protein
VLPRNVFFTPSGLFFTHLGLEAPIELGLTPALNGQGEAALLVVIPVPDVVGEMSFFSAQHDQASARLFDLAHRNSLPLRDLGPLVKPALEGLMLIDILIYQNSHWRLVHQKPSNSAACSALPTCSNDTAFCASVDSVTHQGASARCSARRCALGHRLSSLGRLALRLGAPTWSRRRPSLNAGPFSRHDTLDRKVVKLNRFAAERLHEQVHLSANALDRVMIAGPWAPANV